MVTTSLKKRQAQRRKEKKRKALAKKRITVSLFGPDALPFADLLKQFQYRHGLTNRQLAAVLGVDPAYVSRGLNERRIYYLSLMYLREKLYKAETARNEPITGDNALRVLKSSLASDVKEFGLIWW